MDLRQFRYFAALAESLRFDEAARRFNMTQPPLSKRIAELEEALGVRLFDRNSSGFPLDTSRKVIGLFTAEARSTRAEARVVETTTADQHGMLLGGELNVGILR